MVSCQVGKRKKDRAELPFAVGHGLKSKTRMTSFSTGHFLGNKLSPNITVVDTPGFKVKYLHSSFANKAPDALIPVRSIVILS